MAMQWFWSLFSLQNGTSDDCVTERDFVTSQERDPQKTSNSTKQHKIESEDTSPNQVSISSSLKRYNIDKCFALLTGADSATNGQTYLGFIRKDLERMERVLKELQFDVSNPCLVHENKDGVLTVSRAFLFDDCITHDLSQYSCSLFYFSGHGDTEKVILSNGESAKYAEIVQKFNASSTNGPTIFIFDCCLDHPPDDPEESPQEFCTEMHAGDIPANVLVVFACMPDQRTFGNKQTGSFFTLKLDNKLRAFVDQLSFVDIVHQVTGTSKDHKNPFVISTLQQHLDFGGRLNQRRPSFRSKEDVMDHIETIGHGVKVLVLYCPDPKSARGCVADQQGERSRRVKDTREHVARLVNRLECHGFSVFTDLHKGGEDHGQLFKWYCSHMESDDFILVVCSQGFKELCHMERLDKEDMLAKLVYSCCKKMYDCQVAEPDSKKFIPVVIDHMSSDSVPPLYRGSILYDVTDEKEFNYDSHPYHYGFDALVCRMAGIDRAKIEKTIRGSVQQIRGEGAMCMDVPEPDIASYLTLKPGYKFVSPEQQSKAPKVPRLDQLTEMPLPREPNPPPPPPHQTTPPPQTTPPHQTIPPHPLPLSFLSTQASGGSDLVATLPSSPVNQTVFLWLCASIVQWKFFARFLGVSEPDIADIEARDPGDLKEQCYQMLLRWRGRNPQGSYRDIGAAIAESGKNCHLLGGYVEEVQKLLNGQEHMEQ